MPVIVICRLPRCGLEQVPRTLIVPLLKPFSSNVQPELPTSGEAKRDDENFSFVGAWEYQGADKPPLLHKEPLVYEEVHMSTRSYK